MSRPVSGKRIAGLTAEMPASEAARRTLEARLAAVEAALPEAVERGLENPKTVHRLRVATRRSSAALRVFAPWIPSKRRRKVERQLRSIRRAAGEARMADVHAGLFAEMVADADAPLASALGLVIGRIAGERIDAQRSIERIARHKKKGFDRLRVRNRGLIESISSGEETSLGELAAKSLPEVIDRMRELGGADLGEIDSVHALRIIGKRFRYAVEVFESCFDSSDHEALLARMVGFQDRLGTINDLCEMAERVERYEREFAIASSIAADSQVQGGIERLGSLLGERLDAAHKEFVVWWGAIGVQGIVDGASVPGASVSGAMKGDVSLGVAPVEGARTDREVSFGQGKRRVS